MQSQAPTVAKYLAALSPDRRKAIATVRSAIKEHLPSGYAETMQYGMISYVVPLRLYPAGYLGKPDVPLPFVSLASQKNYMAVYLMHVYADPKLDRWFKAAWKKAGKKLDMGKACLRFKQVDELALDVLGLAVAGTPVAEHVARYEQSRKSPGN
jgi:hypothetical protein